MAKSYASSTTIPLAVNPNPMREMAFRKVDAVKREKSDAPRRPEQLSKWPQERAVLKLVL